MRLLPVIPDGLMNGTVNDNFLSDDIKIFIDLVRKLKNKSENRKQILELLRTLKDKKQEFLDAIKSM